MKCSIDSNTREIIFLDKSECFGVEFDKNIQRIEFSTNIEVGDILCVKSLINYPTSSSSKQPSGWTIRKKQIIQLLLIALIS